MSVLKLRLQRLILKFLLCLTILLLPSYSHALTLKEHLELSEIKGKIIYYASVNNVDIDLALHVVEHESFFNPKEIGDEHITCPTSKEGKPVYARGLFQITRCYHPEISDDDAFDPDFAIVWAIPKMKSKKLCMQEWTVCRNYYNGIGAT